MSRLIPFIVDRTDRVIILIGVVMLAAYVSAVELLPKPHGRVVFGDATHHFVQLRSLVFDRDLDFKNDYLTIYRLERGEPGTEWIFTELTPTGHVRNYMTLGPALLWAPIYLAVSGVLWLLSAAGLRPPPNGFDHVLQVVPGVTGIVAATAAALVSWRLARRLVGPVGAAVGVLVVWLGSHALYYSLISPSYSHAGSMLACGIFFAHYLCRGSARAPHNRPGSGEPWGVGRAAASGALAGVASLMRWQDALFLALPIYETLRSAGSWRRRAAGMAAASAGWAIVFSPQMAVWHTLYGRWLALPQGPSFMRWTGPRLLDVLFSDNHGLLSWAPVIAVALVGLAIFTARHRRAALPIVFVVASAWYVNAAVADWWAGEAFGARRFLSLFPLCVLGLAQWTDPPARRGRKLALLAVLVAVTWLLLLQYEVFMKGHPEIAPYPKGAFNFLAARFVVPFRLLAHLW